MRGLHCFTCKQEIHKIAYSVRDKGYLCPDCWDILLKEKRYQQPKTRKRIDKPVNFNV